MSLFFFFFYEILHGTILSISTINSLFQLLILYLPFRSSKHQKVLVQAFPLIENTPGPFFFLAIIKSRSNAETEYCAMASTNIYFSWLSRKLKMLKT
jgi:hypothetical protein